MKLRAPPRLTLARAGASGHVLRRGHRDARLGQGYDSIHHGSSHGCHRLFNHQSIRLGDFLLHHREHKIMGKGDPSLGYGRQVLWKGKSLTLKMENGGFRYELTPPIRSRRAAWPRDERREDRPLAPAPDPRPRS